MTTTSHLQLTDQGFNKLTTVNPAQDGIFTIVFDKVEFYSDAGYVVDLANPVMQGTLEYTDDFIYDRFLAPATKMLSIRLSETALPLTYGSIAIYSESIIVAVIVWDQVQSILAEQSLALEIPFKFDYDRNNLGNLPMELNSITKYDKVHEINVPALIPKANNTTVKCFRINRDSFSPDVGEFSVLVHSLYNDGVAPSVMEWIPEGFSVVFPLNSLISFQSGGGPNEVIARFPQGTHDDFLSQIKGPVTDLLLTTVHRSPDDPNDPELGRVFGVVDITLGYVSGFEEWTITVEPAHAQESLTFDGSSGFKLWQPVTRGSGRFKVNTPSFVPANNDTEVVVNITPTGDYEIEATSGYYPFTSDRNVKVKWSWKSDMDLTLHQEPDSAFVVPSTVVPVTIDFSSLPEGRHNVTVMAQIEDRSGNRSKKAYLQVEVTVYGAIDATSITKYPADLQAGIQYTFTVQFDSGGIEDELLTTTWKLYKDAQGDNNFVEVLSAFDATELRQATYTPDSVDVDDQVYVTAEVASSFDSDLVQSGTYTINVEAGTDADSAISLSLGPVSTMAFENEIIPSPALDTITGTALFAESIEAASPNMWQKNEGANAANFTITGSPALANPTVEKPIRVRRKTQTTGFGGDPVNSVTMIRIDDERFLTVFATPSTHPTQPDKMGFRVGMYRKGYQAHTLDDDYNAVFINTLTQNEDVIHLTGTLLEHDSATGIDHIAISWASNADGRFYCTVIQVAGGSVLQTVPFSPVVHLVGVPDFTTSADSSTTQAPNVAIDVLDATTFVVINSRWGNGAGTVNKQVHLLTYDKSLVTITLEDSAQVTDTGVTRDFRIQALTSTKFVVVHQNPATPSILVESFEITGGNTLGSLGTDVLVLSNEHFDILKIDADNCLLVHTDVGPDELVARNLNVPDVGAPTADAPVVLGTLPHILGTGSSEANYFRQVYLLPTGVDGTTMHFAVSIRKGDITSLSSTHYGYMVYTGTLDTGTQAITASSNITTYGSEYVPKNNDQTCLKPIYMRDGVAILPYILPTSNQIGHDIFDIGQFVHTVNVADDGPTAHITYHNTLESFIGDYNQNDTYNNNLISVTPDLGKQFDPTIDSCFLACVQVDNAILVELIGVGSDGVLSSLATETIVDSNIDAQHHNVCGQEFYTTANTSTIVFGYTIDGGGGANATIRMVEFSESGAALVGTTIDTANIVAGNLDSIIDTCYMLREELLGSDYAIFLLDNGSSDANLYRIAVSPIAVGVDSSLELLDSGGANVNSIHSYADLFLIRHNPSVANTYMFCYLDSGPDIPAFVMVESNSGGLTQIAADEAPDPGTNSPDPTQSSRKNNSAYTHGGKCMGRIYVFDQAAGEIYNEYYEIHENNSGKYLSPVGEELLIDTTALLNSTPSSITLIELKKPQNDGNDVTYKDGSGTHLIAIGSESADDQLVLVTADLSNFPARIIETHTYTLPAAVDQRLGGLPLLIGGQSSNTATKDFDARVIVCLANDTANSMYNVSVRYNGYQSTSLEYHTVTYYQQAGQNAWVDVIVDGQSVETMDQEVFMSIFGDVHVVGVAPDFALSDFSATVIGSYSIPPFYLTSSAIDKANTYKVTFDFDVGTEGSYSTDSIEIDPFNAILFT